MKKKKKQEEEKEEKPGTQGTILCFSGWGIGVLTSGRVWKRGTHWTLDCGHQWKEANEPRNNEQID